MKEEHKEMYIEEEEKYFLLKILFLGIIALALCASGPLSLFASVPLCLAFLLFGRSKGLILIVVGLLGTILLPKVSAVFGHLWGIYLLAAINSVVISEMLMRKVRPAKGVLVSGFVIVTLIALIFSIFTLSMDTTLEAEVEKIVVQTIDALKAEKENQVFLKSSDENAIALRNFIDNPKTMVTQILNWMPSIIFASTFFSIWVSFFLLLRNGQIWKHKINYPYDLKDLTGFRLPYEFVWPLIVGLTLFAGSKYFLGPWGEVLGGNILVGLAVFYFFQGFGVYLETLTHYKIFGLFRTLLVMTTLFMAWQLIVLVGVFDMWVNFRKFFNKKNQNDEGDTI